MKGETELEYQFRKERELRDREKFQEGYKLGWNAAFEAVQDILEAWVRIRND